MRTNNTLAARQVGEQIDTLQVGIFRALRRRTAQEAFDESSASVADLAAICAPGRPGVSLSTTLLTIVVSQQVQYFNVSKTMNAAQVAMTVDDIIDRFGYMTLEEIATAFAIRRRTAQVYDRLDPNTLLSWLYEYDYERDILCEQQARRSAPQHDALPSSNDTRSSSNDTRPSSNDTRLVSSAAILSQPMTFNEYVRWLETEAAKGNPDAIRAKAIYDENLSRMEEPSRREAAFQAWRKKMGV